MFAKDGLLDDLKKALSERILNAELDEHLDGERVEGGANRRNDHSKKSVLTGTSKMTLSNPRDRAGTFDPKGAAHWLKIKNPPCRSGNQRRKLWLRCMKSAIGRVSRVSPVHTARRNCTRDEGGPFEVGNQVLITSHRKLLLSKAMVVSVAETAGRDPVRQG